MASYKILPLQNEGIDLEKIQNRVNQLSALESSAELRRGTLPRTFSTFQEEMCYVQYAQEEETEVTTLEGEDKPVKVADMYPVIFLGNRFVAHDANLPNNEVENEVVRMVSDLLETDIHYEPIEFDKDSLESVVNQAKKVREADFDPSSEKPDSVSARHLPGLQDTSFWQKYRGDPMEKVRVDLPDQSTYNVSFYENGKITVHGQQIPPEVQVDLLRYITDEVISNLEIDSFQKKIGGSYE